MYRLLSYLRALSLSNAVNHVALEGSPNPPILFHIIAKLFNKTAEKKYTLRKQCLLSIEKEFFMNGKGLNPTRTVDSYEALETMALVKTRHKCFWLAAVLGALAAILDDMLLLRPVSNLFFQSLTGVFLVMVGSFMGALCGSLLRNTVLWIRHLPLDEGDASIDGSVLGAFAGAFCGLVFKLIVWSPETAHLGVAAGATIGAFLGALPGEHVTVIVRMAASEEPSPRKRVS